MCSMKEVVESALYTNSAINRKYETFLTNFSNIGLNTSTYNVS